MDASDWQSSSEALLLHNRISHSFECAAGHTVASNSSKGSVDETSEMVNSSYLAKPTAVAPPASEDATCYVSNSVQHRKIVHRPLQSSMRGPRRIGERP